MGCMLSLFLFSSVQVHSVKISDRSISCSRVQDEALQGHFKKRCCINNCLGNAKVGVLVMTTPMFRTQDTDACKVFVATSLALDKVCIAG